MQWPALGVLRAVFVGHQPLKRPQSRAHALKWTSSRAREGRNWTHALIMLYFRWYPVVSHFNNPPQLDVLVPSARQRLVTGLGWKLCWGLASSTLMESTMRDTHPAFYCFPPYPATFSFHNQMVPPVCWGGHRLGSEQGMAGRRATQTFCSTKYLSLSIKAFSAEGILCSWRLQKVTRIVWVLTFCFSCV